ncbi:glycerophosphoryl diester phosphodiesterase [Vibrio sp. SCSIO 43140]|uniref:glycerophosphodiester phosphodiesterase family protein n=1 Tax=Vibrio sp. SCSIO 43140 TaxID=2819100 RepID=UPI002075B07A|nr:glycerophosphodiester phosphodiesterase family protein [Vibrio sp. SCSIO 43140]USD59663.1 glycerophosphoryl diester phosphodiesterase [Vibrio sp. SCSIO 43140]
MSVIFVGHRGVAGTHPENTMVSIQAAKQLDMKWVEVDVQPTKDNVLVVCHDHTVNRCSNGKGRVDELTLKELQALDFGSWKSAEFQGESIITLEALLEFCGANDMSINLEVKVDSHDPAYVVSLLKTELEKSAFNKSNLIISSFSNDVMRELHQAELGIRLGVLAKRVNRKTLATILDVNAFSCHLNYKWLTANHINILRELDVEIWCYTVNNPKSFKHLDSVDAIFTDFPTRFEGATNFETSTQP